MFFHLQGLVNMFAGVGNNLVSNSQHRLAAFAAAVLGYKILLEKAWQMLPETVFHACRNCLPRSEENDALVSILFQST